MLTYDRYRCNQSNAAAVPSSSKTLVEYPDKTSRWMVWMHTLSNYSQWLISVGVY